MWGLPVTVQFLLWPLLVGIIWSAWRFLDPKSSPPPRAGEVWRIKESPRFSVCVCTVVNDEVFYSTVQDVGIPVARFLELFELERKA